MAADIIEITSYSQYKQMLDTELKTNVESFVRIGYLLKVARDTNVLTESGYNNVAEFAQAEYGLTKDVVSRYIAINDRYSENGYSDRLQSRFENYGVAKLAEMLTLPDNIIAEIEPTLTRKEIQDIKREIAEEEQISPLEVLAEAAEEKNIADESTYSLTQRAWKAYFAENKPVYEKLVGEFNDETCLPFPSASTLQTLIDVLAPSGSAVLFARVPGIGKLMISIKAADQPITFTNTRDGSRTESDAERVYHDIFEVFGQISKTAWSWVYGEPFEAPKPEPKPEPKKPEVAPVQQPEPIVPKSEQKPEVPAKDFMPEPAQETFNNAKESFDNVKPEVDNVKPEFDNTESAKEIEAAVVETEPEEPTEEQLPGQTEIEDFPEYLPKVEAEVVEEEPAEPFDEHKAIEDMLGKLHAMRKILAEHATELDDDITEDELIEIEAQIFDLTATIKKLRRSRG